MDKWGFQFGNKPAGPKHVQGRISGKSVSSSNFIAKGVVSSESVSFLLCESFVMLHWLLTLININFPLGFVRELIPPPFEIGRLPRRIALFFELYIPERPWMSMPLTHNKEILSNPGICAQNQILLISDRHLLLHLPVSYQLLIWGREWTTYGTHFSRLLALIDATITSLTT